MGCDKISIIIKPADYIPNKRTALILLNRKIKADMLSKREDRILYDQTTIRLFPLSTLFLSTDQRAAHDPFERRYFSGLARQSTFL
jgi:hypothetical protein